MVTGLADGVVEVTRRQRVDHAADYRVLQAEDALPIAKIPTGRAVDELGVDANVVAAAAHAAFEHVANAERSGHVATSAALPL